MDGLEAVSRFGWLTRDQITRLLWPCSSSGTRGKLGNRLLGKAQEKGLLLRRVIDGGGSAYVLRPSGAAFLNGLRPQVVAKSGLDLRLGNVRHRSLTNNVLITQMLQGAQVWTEFEILTRRMPALTIAGKMPDGAVLHVDDEGAELQWIEVEAHSRKTADFEALLQFIRGSLAAACQGPYQISEKTYLTGLGLYFAEDHLGATLTQRLSRVADEERWPDTLQDAIELYSAHQTARGRWDGLEQVGTLLFPPENWRGRRLSATESALTERVRRMGAELEQIKSRASKVEAPPD
uniref:Uncharacterized protein n=1 Tax=Acidithiobacillus sulfuriphilus TaxID=1867749 RepID=A0A3M8QTA3_9PROT|nr:hypothetical protein EC580_14170 [Acidithiobacillus sulfuriphilus]